MGRPRPADANKASILADTVEAIIGAVYLDRGGDVATAFVLRIIDPLLTDPDRFGASMDPKTSLQESAARHGKTAPVYAISESGPDHSKVFVATVTVGDVSATGEGTSKKQAEMAAALEAWSLLDGGCREVLHLREVAQRMPELPEVEVVRAGLEPAVTGASSPVSRCSNRGRSSGTPSRGVPSSTSSRGDGCWRPCVAASSCGCPSTPATPSSRTSA